MDLFSIVLIAIGLAMDAFAVSVTSGATFKNLNNKHVLKMATSFGGFQAIMPVIGWLAGLGLKDFISEIDHWIAFGLLSIVGIRMIVNALRFKKENKNECCMTFYLLMMLSIATSIDALVIGMAFGLLKVSIILPILVIGLVTFLLSLLGIYIGKRFGHLFENKIEVIGGIILIAIGIKILYDHLSQG